jgi:trimeric autotransporter adhesin
VETKLEGAMKNMKTAHKVAGVLCLVAIWLVPKDFAQNVTTVAGGFVGDGRTATAASFNLPYDVARDKSGNTYVSDNYDYRIRKISTTGIISTYAGTGIAGYSGDGGPATSAMLFNPVGLAFDPAGELVVADYTNNRVRKIDASGNISTIAGDGIPGYSGDGGPAASASLNGPINLTYDSAGNLYISDDHNNVVRKVDTTGTITTFAGDQSTPGFCGDNGPATSACLNRPRGLTTDSKGNVYISDGYNFRVREVNSAGIINTIAGNGQNSYSGDGGPATLAGMGRTFGVSVKNGILYIATGATDDSRVRDVVLSSGIINTFIGSTTGYDGDGHSPSATQFDGPDGILPLSSSTMIVVDRFNDRLRELSGGVVKTIAGGFIGDGGPATSAYLLYPESIAFDSAGDYYVPDYDGNRIRKIATTGKISTVAGTGITGYTGDGGPATSADLSFPAAVAVDSTNNVYLVDQDYRLIRKIDGTTQTITTFSANPSLLFLTGLAVDASGNLYAADAAACVIWKFDSSGTPTAVAGQSGNCGYNGDGVPATSALLNEPWSLSFDSAGNMFVADSGNMRVRRINSVGIISTFAGNGTPCASSTSPCGDGGKATSAQLDFPVGVAVSGGTAYIADEFDLRIRKVTAGTITTYAGTGLPGYNGDGPALSTNLDDPVAVAVNPINKVLYLVDDIQARVRRVH